MCNFFIEVIKKDPRALSPERIADPALLEPVTRRKVLACIEDLKGNGVKCVLYETYRSEQRQEELFRQKATELRQVGCHHFGVAADIVMLDEHGNPTWDASYSHGYHLLSHAAAAHGLVWGGTWFSPKTHPSHNTSFPDLPHVQRIAVADQHKLLNGSWYPDESYIPE